MIRNRRQLAAAARRARRPSLELLEDRRLLTSLVVENTNPNGLGSLALAISLANRDNQVDTITFDPSAFSTHQTITLDSTLVLSNNSNFFSIVGPTAGVTISGAGKNMVLEVSTFTTAFLSNLTITGGANTSGSPMGGGIVNSGKLTLTNCTVSGNSGVGGGGIENAGDQLSLTNCTVSGNTANYYAGGILSIYGTVSLTNCTVSGNSAKQRGGGIVLGILSAQKSLRLTNCTVSGNAAPQSSGIHMYNINYNTMSLTNCIVAGNVGGNNIDGAYAGSNNLTQGNPGLTPLGDYGGPTQTMGLLPGSPAIGAGTTLSGFASIPQTDQRGAPLDSPAPDIGAFQIDRIVVTTTLDYAPFQNVVTLRGAIGLANTFAGSQITFDPQVFSSAETIGLGLGALDLTNTALTTTIAGPTARLTISGAGRSGVFEVSTGVTASISGLTIKDGVSTSGGGIDNAGTLTVTNCLIAQNTASQFGGGVYNKLLSTANLTLDNCTLRGNTAQFGGGLENAGTATLESCTISGNSATTVISGSGGGLDNYSGAATLTNCTIKGNTASGRGGGLYSKATMALIDCTISGNTSGNNGGGIYSHGPMTLYGSTVSGNAATGQNPLTSYLIQRAAASSASGGLQGYGGGIYQVFGTATVTNCTISGNSAGFGGGLFNWAPMTLTGAAVSGNVAFYGGGIENKGGLTLTNSSVSGNSATNGGGLCDYNSTTLYDSTVSGNSATYGGGLINKNGATVLIDATVSGNSATHGGGLWNSDTMTLINATVSGNSATDGGGILNGGRNGTVTLTDTIVADNSAPTQSDVEGTLQSTSQNNLIGTGGSGGLLNGSNGNIVLTSQTRFSQNNPAGLAPPGDYGGATQTVALLPGSPALGQGGAVATLGQAVTDATSVAIPLASGFGLDAISLPPLASGDDFVIRVDSEQMAVTALTPQSGGTATLTVVRGANGTTAATHASGATVWLAFDQRGKPLDSPNPDIGAFQSQGFAWKAADGSSPQPAQIGSAFPNPLAVFVLANNPKEPVTGGLITFTAPTTGASATLSSNRATIAFLGVAYVTATANGTPGSYRITASASGLATKVNFDLINNTNSMIQFPGGASHTLSLELGPNPNTYVYAFDAGPFTVPLPIPALLTINGVSGSHDVVDPGNYSGALKLTNTGGVSVHGTPGNNAIAVTWHPGDDPSRDMMVIQDNSQTVSMDYTPADNDPNLTITVWGGSGNNTIVLGPDPANKWTAIFHGGPGANTLIAGPSEDRAILYGGGGPTTLIANAGVDQLIAGPGKTTFILGSGSATLIGVTSRDRIIPGSGTFSLVPLPSSGFGKSVDAFVETVYEDELGRLPDPSRLRYWSGKLAAGLDEKAMVELVARSAQHRSLVASGAVVPFAARRVYSHARAAAQHAREPIHKRNRPGGPPARATREGSGFRGIPGKSESHRTHVGPDQTRSGS